MIIGPKMMQEKNLEIGNSPTKYDPERDPRVTNEFATVIRCASISCFEVVSEKVILTFCASASSNVFRLFLDAFTQTFLSPQSKSESCWS